MIRFLLEYAVPIALPSLIYLAWLVYENRRIARGGEGVLRKLEEGPWAWLLAGGMLLAVAATMLLAVIGETGTEGRYVPPRVENGQVVPGHIEPAKPGR